MNFRKDSVMSTQAGRPVGQLLGDVVNDVTDLIQVELRLLRAELRDNLKGFANGGVLVGAAAVFLISGLGVALLALSEWLIVAGLSREWALTLVAIIALLIGGILASRGITRIKTTPLVPER